MGTHLVEGTPSVETERSVRAFAEALGASAARSAAEFPGLFKFALPLLGFASCADEKTLARYRRPRLSRAERATLHNPARGPKHSRLRRVPVRLAREFQRREGPALQLATPNLAQRALAPREA